MTKLKIGAVGVALIAVAASMIWQEHRAKRLLAEVGDLRHQLAAAESLREENQRLAEEMTVVTQHSKADLDELIRLRGLAGTIHQLQQENARLRSDRLNSAAQPPRDRSEVQEQRPYRYTQQQSAFFIERLNFGKRLGLALRKVAQQNNGHLPPDLTSAASWLATNAVPIEGDTGPLNGVGANHFELVYRGSLSDLKSQQQTIIARERDPVQVHEGRWTRMYVFADGHVERLEATSADGFPARERELWPAQPPP